jgi:hypothetical protein
LVRCPYFVLEFVRATRIFSPNLLSRPTLILVLHGAGILGDFKTGVPLSKGQSWFLPFHLGPIEIHPRGTLSLLACDITNPHSPDRTLLAS